MNEYTKAQWEDEIAALYERGEGPRPCPQCGRAGFFGPRQNAQRTRQYRFCKFCGFGQDVGAQPIRYRATVHGCPPWRQVAGAPYIWWVLPEEATYECPYCRKSVSVTSALVRAPADDPSHPWWRVPQQLSHAAAAAFWEGEGYFRFYL